jgi:HCOMODA/2-hydroxy-3-carboxy-muconic semialdehyde decarboxylase
MQTKTIVAVAVVASATVLAQDAPRREQALLEELALGNRILARQLDILDIQGHLTARSRTNPDRYYIARFVSPGGASVGDFVENTLESVPVDGPRTDQAREIYLHGEIYKARPDVMAVVHAHAPEYVAFGMSSVPLWDGAAQVPVWDIRPVNRGRSGIVNTPALGKAMAEKMGKAPAVLLWGHGIALGGSSIADAVLAAAALRDTARLQQAAVDTGATWKPEAKGQPDRAGLDRSWAHYRRVELKRTGGRVPQSPEPTPARPADPVKGAAHDLMLANRILADQLGIIDTHGQVSVRNPADPNSYLIAPGVAPGSVTVADVVERDLAHGGAAHPVHADIYTAQRNVRAILYARTPEVMAFSRGAPGLRPIVNGGAFLANDNRLFRDGGYVLTAGTLYALVDRAYQLRQNAIVQRQAMALRGSVAYLNEKPAEPVSPNEPQAPAPTGPAEGRSWIYWSQNVSLD